MPIQLLYILYRFDRVTRMTADESLTRRFDALVDSLGAECTVGYRALYRLADDVAAELLLRLPRELVGLVADYCRLDVLALADEELIINRILG